MFTQVVLFIKDKNQGCSRLYAQNTAKKYQKTEYTTITKIVPHLTVSLRSQVKKHTSSMTLWTPHENSVFIRQEDVPGGARGIFGK